jgi:hypothetical protein
LEDGPVLGFVQNWAAAEQPNNFTQSTHAGRGRSNPNPATTPLGSWLYANCRPGIPPLVRQSRTRSKNTNGPAP